MWFINWFRYCTKKNVSGGCIILLLLISWQKIYCFIYCFGRLLQISTLSATHATQHTNTHMAGKASPPPPSYTCLGPRESGKDQETNPAEGAGGGARPPKALNPKLHACTLIMGALASHPWMHPTIPAPSRICFLPPPSTLVPSVRTSVEGIVCAPVHGLASPPPSIFFS